MKKKVTCKHGWEGWEKTQDEESESVSAAVANTRCNSENATVFL